MALRMWVRDNVFASYKRVVSRREIRAYLMRNAHPRLNIGGGGNRIPGWLNVDLTPPPGAVFMDAGLPWPFADGSVDAVLCEHMIEHVPKSLGQHILSEACRTLAPGRRARVVTPDLAWFARRLLERDAPAEDQLYLDFTNSFLKRSSTSWCDAMNLCFYEHGHRYIWSIDELSTAMTLAGFVDLVVTRAGSPADEVFRGAEGHPRLVGDKVNALEAFAIEGRATAKSSSRTRSAERCQSTMHSAALIERERDL